MNDMELSILSSVVAKNPKTNPITMQKNKTLVICNNRPESIKDAREPNDEISTINKP